MRIALAAAIMAGDLLTTLSLSGAPAEAATNTITVASPVTLTDRVLVTVPVTVVSVCADIRRLPPPRRGTSRKGSGRHALTTSREASGPPAGNSGDRQPGDHPAAQPDFSMAVDRAVQLSPESRADHGM